MGRSTGWAFVATLMLLVATLGVAGCGEQDPGPLGARGIDGLSVEGQRQEYVEGVGRALQQLGQAQGPGFGKAIDAGNARQLQTSALAWRQGGEQLKQVDPPKEVVDAHLRLVKAVDGLSAWNDRIAKAAPNKAMTRKLGKQAANSPASKAFEAAVCDIVNAGYDVVDPGACSPLDDASPIG